MYNYGLTKEFRQTMEKELHVVYFESANYCGAGEHCLVWATSEDDALENDSVMAFAEDFYRDQDEEQFMEEHEDEELDEVVWASIMSATKLEGSKFEEYVAKQPDLYPEVNFK